MCENQSWALTGFFYRMYIFFQTYSLSPFLYQFYLKSLPPVKLAWQTMQKISFSTIEKIKKYNKCPALSQTHTRTPNANTHDLRGHFPKAIWRVSHFQAHKCAGGCFLNPGYVNFSGREKLKRNFFCISAGLNLLKNSRPCQVLLTKYYNTIYNYITIINIYNISINYLTKYLSSL